MKNEHEIIKEIEYVAMTLKLLENSLEHIFQLTITENNAKITAKVNA